MHNGKLVVMFMDEFREKRHVMVFKTSSGEVVVGTNDLTELSSQDWFREFLNIRIERKSEPVYERPQPRPQPQPVQRPVMQPRRPAQPAFVEYNSDTMTEQIWNQMDESQRKEWMTFYGIQA
jgi:hypothetical protein